MKKLFIAFLLFALILPVFGQNQDEFKFSLVPRRVAVPSLSGYLEANGTVPLTANWPMGAFELSQATWKGVAVGVGYGGTGLASYAVGDLLYASGATALSKLAGVAVGQVLVSGGVTTAPAWSDNPSVASLVLTGTGTFASTAGNVSLTTSIVSEDSVEAAFTLAYTTDKTAANNDTGLKIVQTDTASGGTSYLQEWYTGSTQVGYMTNAGAFQCDSNITLGGTLYFTVNEYIERSTNLLQLKAANKISFVLGVDNPDTNVSFNFSTGSGVELTDTDAQQSFMLLAPKINQSGTAGYEGIKINVTETGIGSGMNRLISGQISDVEKWGVDNRGGQMVGMTPDAVMQVGMVAMADAGTDGRYDINGVNNESPIGIVGGSGPTTAGTARGLVVSGMGYVAPAEDVVAVVRGYVAFQDASDAGYADFAANVAASRHDYEVGHPIYAEAAIAFDGEVDVDPTANTIVLDSTPAWVVGDPVIYWDSGDTAPAGMVTGTVYWIKTIATATVTLSATRGGAVLDITGDGSGTTMYLMRLPMCVIHWN